MTKKLALLAIIFMFLGLVTGLGALVSNYTFAQSSGTYTEITGGTTLVTGTFDTQAYTGKDIGFTFRFNGVNYTQFSVKGDGYISFGSTAPNSATPISATTAFAGAISAYGGDLQNASSSSTISYITEGTSPNRVLTVQWKGVRRYNVSSENLNFQIKLYETTNVAQVIYGTCVGGASTSYYPQVGLRGATNADYLNRTTTANWSATTAGTSNSATCLVSATVFPTNGMVFTYTPYVEYPVDLAVTALVTPTSTTNDYWGAEAVKVTVRNNGTATMDFAATPATISGSVTKPDATVVNFTDVVVNTGTLASNATLDVTFPGTLNMLAAGSYTFNASVSVTGDGVASNNALTPVVKTNNASFALPYTQDFNASTSLPTGWTGTMSPTANHGTSSSNGLTKNLYSSVTTCNATVQKISDITASSLLTFDYRYVNYTSYPATATTLTTGDKLEALVSTDGVNYTVVKTINSTNHVTSTNFAGVSVDLAAYAGQTIAVKFLGTWGSGDYYLDIDNVKVYTMAAGPAIAIAPSPLTFAAGYITVPYTSNLSVSNTGAAALEITSVSVAAPFSCTYSGTIAAGGSATVPVVYTPTTVGSHSQVLTFNINGTFTGTNTVTLNGSAIDPTITTFPYTQNFDGVTTPALPSGWTALVSTTGAVTTSTSYYQSSPNAASLSNGSDLSGYLYLIAPPVNNLNTKRIKFYARAGYTAQPLIVGVMTNPSDPATFTTIGTIAATTTTFTQYTVSLGSYAGSGRYVAIKHGNTSTYSSQYIDNVTIEDIPMAPEMSVSTTAVAVGYAPAGLTRTKSFSIINAGAAALHTTLTVPAGITISPASPITVAANSSQLITVSFSSTTEGAYQDTIRIAGDDTAHPSANITVTATVEAALAAGVLDIGGGNTVDMGLPCDPYYGYSYTQTVYPQSEINTANKKITKVAYRYNGGGLLTNTGNITIYMGHTTKTAFASTSDWVTLSNLTQVYANTASLGVSAAGWIEFTLDTPFVYNNTDNLVIAFRENKAEYDAIGDDFYATPVTTNRSIVYRNDSTSGDPATPPTGVLSANIPDTRMTLVDVPTNAVFSVAPTTKAFGTIFLGQTGTAQTFTVRNDGLAPLTISSITLGGTDANQFTLVDTTVYPKVLGLAQTMTFSANFAPTTAGAKTATITVLDDQARASHTVTLTGTGYDPILYPPTLQVFDTYPPADWSRFTGFLKATSALTTTTSGWVQDDYANVTSPVNKSARVEIYGTSNRYWLVTPPIQLGNGSVPYQMEFDLAMTKYAALTADTLGVDDTLAVVISTDNGTTWSNANILQQWGATTPLTIAGQHITIPLTSYTGLVKVGFYASSTVSNKDNDVFVDNFRVRMVPEIPQFSCTPEAKEFGTQYINTHSARQTFTISNIGPGVLEINEPIAITGTDAADFVLIDSNEYPIALENGQSSTVQVEFAPATAGAKTAYVTVYDNIEKVENKVTLTGTGFDPVVYSFPYTENFDAVTTPALPLGWTKKIVSTSTPDIYTTTSSSPHSTPNHIYFYNSGENTTGSVILAARPVQTLTDKKVSFWAKAGSAGYTMIVGTMTDPTNEATFTPMQTLTLTASYAQYTFSLMGYTGTDKYVAVKHGLGGTYRSIYIDDYTMSILPNAPEMTTSPASISFDNVYAGTAKTKTFTVTNTGLQSLTASLSGVDSQIVTSPVSPFTVAPGQTQTVSIYLTATTVGTYTDTLIVSGNDPANASDTIALSATVLAALPEGLIEIGDGTITNMSLPIEPYFGYTYSQTIYLQSEINKSNQMISKLYYNFNGNSAWSDSINVYMGHTSKTSFSSTTDWIPVANLSQVYAGRIAVTRTRGWVELVLPTPFFYNNTDNLVIAVDEETAGFHSSTDEFYCTAVADNRAISYHNDTTNPSPAAPPTGTLAAYIPDTRLQFIAAPADPVFASSITSKNFGEALLNTMSADQSIRFSNSGGGTLSITSVTLTGTGAASFVLTDTATYPVALGIGNGYNVAVKFAPTTAGAKTANLHVVYATGTADIALTGTAIDPIIRTFPYTQGFENDAIPVGWTNDGAKPWTVGSESHSGNCAAMILYSTLGTGILTTPTIELPANHRLSFWWKDDDITSRVAGYDTTWVEISTDGGTSWTTLASLSQEENDTEYSQVKINLNSYAGNNVKIRWRDYSDGTYSAYGTGLDDILIEEILPVTAPEITLSVENNNPKITWEAVANATGYRIYGAATADATTWTVLATVAGDVTSWVDSTPAGIRFFKVTTLNEPKTKQIKQSAQTTK